MFRHLLLSGVLLTVCAASHAQMTSSQGRWAKPYITAFYDVRECDGEMPTIEERVTVTVHVNPSDVSLPGMMYVGAMTGSNAASILTYPYGIPSEDDGLLNRRYSFLQGRYAHHSPYGWTAWRGGIPDPTIAYEALPRSRTFVIHSSPCGAPRACDRILEMMGDGRGHVDIGAAYGALQLADQEQVARLAEFENLQLSLDHMKAAFTYSDGLQNKRYGVALSFRCDRSYVPLEFRQQFDPEPN